MGRIKLYIPGPFYEKVSIPVRITDMNYGNHLGNDRLVTLLHEARVLWLLRNNLTEIDFGGVSLIQGGLAVEYKSEVFYPETLHFEIMTGERSAVAFELLYRITNSKGLLVANAKTDILSFDYEARKVVPLPEGIFDALH